MAWSSTSFKPGNKAALGLTNSGRPPVYDYIKEAQDLLEWSKREDALTLYDFTENKPYLAQDLSKFAERAPEFQLALNKAKERIARNRERNCNKGKMSQHVWNRTASLYCKALRNHEKELAAEKLEQEIKAKTAVISEYPNQALVDRDLLWVKAQDDLVKKDKIIEDLREKLDASKPKADSLDQSSN